MGALDRSTRRSRANIRAIAVVSVHCDPDTGMLLARTYNQEVLLLHDGALSQRVTRGDVFHPGRRARTLPLSRQSGGILYFDLL